MITHICLSCQAPFIPDKYHPNDQEHCSKPECRRASHKRANRKWRAGQKRDDPLRESHRKQKDRRGEKFRSYLELSRWRKQLARQQMLLLGILGFFSGNTGDDLVKTISRCLDTGRELLPKELISWGDLAENSLPGFGFS
jgi:hypothetical protein